MPAKVCPATDLSELAFGRFGRRLAELEAKVAALGKNSRTSSKPPTSDIIKPPEASSGGGKRRGKKH